jgi:serine/threonine protein kinase
MQPEEVRAGQFGPEENKIRVSGPIIGHILYERFLVERDLSDDSIGRGFSSFLVKDLKNYCRHAVLKTAWPVPADPKLDSPSLKEVSDVLMRLAHPNIEEILETGRLNDGRPFALTRQYPATTLGRLIESGKRLELEGIAQLVEQIADALSAAHSKGILHCDLRPSNILIPAGDIGAKSIKIINFGSAWPIDVRGESLANVQQVSESLHYAAPELLVKLGHRSPASDIYSLAVLVYRLVTGAVPFAGRDRGGQLEMINAGRPKPPTEGRTDLSDEAGRLILAGLQFEPLWRPQDIDDFGLRLVRMLAPPKGILLIEPQAPPETKILPALEQVAEPTTAQQPEMKRNEIVSVRSVNARAPLSDRAVTWALMIVLMAGALSIPIGQTILKENKAAAAVETMVARPIENRDRHQIRYWIESEQLASRRPNSLAHTNAPGDGMQLTFVSDSAGQAYAFSEWPGDDGRPDYKLIYPVPGRAESEKGVEAEKPVKAAPAALPDGQTAKAIWIVWTAVRNEDLEAIRISAIDGSVTNDDDRRRLRHFLERNRNLRVRISSEDSGGRTILDGLGDSIVHRIELGEGRS